MRDEITEGLLFTFKVNQVNGLNGSRDPPFGVTAIALPEVGPRGPASARFDQNSGRDQSQVFGRSPEIRGEQEALDDQRTYGELEDPAF